MNYYMYFGGQHFGAAAAAGGLNSYADGANLHSDGLPNEPKRSHLAMLHSILLKHSAVIMETSRPIPQKSLGATGLTAFEFGPSGGLTFLENGNGSPGLLEEAAEDGPRSNCSFPFDESAVRYKGLAAAPGAVVSESVCAAACCAAGPTKCNLYQVSAHVIPTAT